MSWTLQIDERQTESISDRMQLRRRLWELHECARETPVFGILRAPNGSSLAIGLGRDISVLSHSEPGGWPTRHVLGDETNQDLVAYNHCGHFTEVPARYSVSIQAAMNAAIEFFITGKPTEDLVWEDD